MQNNGRFMVVAMHHDEKNAAYSGVELLAYMFLDAGFANNQIHSRSVSSRCALIGVQYRNNRSGFQCPKKSTIEVIRGDIYKVLLLSC